MLDEFMGSVEDGTVWDDAPEWAYHTVRTSTAFGFISDLSKRPLTVQVSVEGIGRFAEMTLFHHNWTEEDIIATRPEKDMLKLLMDELEVDNEAELWEEAPEWANYVVQTDHPSVGFASNLGEAEKLQMFNQVMGWTEVMEGDISEWFKEDVLAVRRRAVFSKDKDGNISISDSTGEVRVKLGNTEESICECLHGEIVATMNVLNDPGNCGLIIDEFRFHLCELLEMQRKKLS